MNKSDPLQRAKSAALRYIALRSRTEAEVRARLRRRFDGPVVDEVVSTLKEHLLVDDVQFARRWKENRDSYNPRSASAIRREIVSRGVDRTVADEAVSDVDDEDSAYRAGLKHTRKLDRADLPTFRRRMWGYLKRRGYGDSIARRTIFRLWEERKS